jgi:hypothetical protein
LERLHVSDLALADRHDHRRVGDRLDVAPADADEPNRDDDPILADWDELLRVDLLELPHAPQQRHELPCAIVAAIDGGVERRVRVVQREVRSEEAQVEFRC